MWSNVTMYTAYSALSLNLSVVR